jgi:hypothetical protein
MPKVKKKKVVKKKVVKKKEKTTRKSRESTKELEGLIIKFLRKGKEYTSRQVVEGLGRKPGGKEGGPVVNILKRLAEDKVVKYGPDEEVRGYVWIKE